MFQLTGSGYLLQILSVLLCSLLISPSRNGVLCCCRINHGIASVSSDALISFHCSPDSFVTSCTTQFFVSSKTLSFSCFRSYLPAHVTLAQRKHCRKPKVHTFLGFFFYFVISTAIFYFLVFLIQFKFYDISLRLFFSLQ